VLGSAALHARLATLDPAAATKIESTNTRRIVRALEVCEGSGRPFSSFGPGLDVYPPSPIVQVGLRWERGALTARIEQRVHAMIDAGLVDEVRALRAGGLSRTAAQALGYKELLAHLDGAQSLAESIEQIVVRTRQFAVRQLRWFQRDPRVRWVDVTNDPVAESGPVVAALLEA
jgi:tRNA dimethylallyltransferase